MQEEDVPIFPRVFLAPLTLVDIGHFCIYPFSRCEPVSSASAIVEFEELVKRRISVALVSTDELFELVQLSSTAVSIWGRFQLLYAHISIFLSLTYFDL